MMKIGQQTYHQFLADIKQRIRDARYAALKAVNIEQLQLYWDIGKMIVEKQKKSGWGKSVVEQLSVDLNKEFPGIKGFSKGNLWRMRNFYLAYENNEKLAPLVREIGWSHNIIIFEKCKDNLEREFYIRMVQKYGWSKNILIHQIEGNAYANYMISQTNFEKNLPKKYRDQAILAIKDEYQFDFLDMGDDYSEKQLEKALINNIRQFLMEMGGDFSFIADQYRITIEDKEYKIDLLLYHRRLQCLVAIDLKVGEFIPEFAGKMQFYLTLLNDKVKLKHENPSIGIIVCKSKNRMVVEYALRNNNQPIGVATYTIHSKLPKEWQKLLPSPEVIIKGLENLKTD